MMPSRSYWSSRAIAAVLALSALAGDAPRLTAQDELERECAGFTTGSAAAECALAAAAVRLIQPRMAAAVWGGNPVSGTASTLGMRLGALPRISVGGRLTVVPVDLPPLLDRGTDESERTEMVGLAADVSVGLLPGFSPLPTVGGVLSLDVIARAAYLPFRVSAGFRDDAAWAWAVGARLGALRESFTLPGVSLTGTYGRITEVAFGDRSQLETDGFFEGAVSNWSARLAASKRLFLLGLTGGVGYDRYDSDVALGFRDPVAGPIALDANAVTDQWSAFANAAWTLLIFQAVLEAGWQDLTVPGGLPSGVALDPVRWYLGFAFRISI